MFSLNSIGEGASLALVGHPSNDGVKIKILHKVNVLLHETTDSGWRILVVAVIATCFLDFSDLTCLIKNTEIGVFWLHFLSYSYGTKLGGSNQRASPSTVKNTRAMLVPCHAWKYPLQLLPARCIFPWFLDITYYGGRVLSSTLYQG